MPIHDNLQVTAFHEEITSVATSAVQEGVLEEMMEKVSAMWAKTEFEVSFNEAGRLKGSIYGRSIALFSLTASPKGCQVNCSTGGHQRVVAHNTSSFDSIAFRRKNPPSKRRLWRLVQDQAFHGELVDVLDGCHFYVPPFLSL